MNCPYCKSAYVIEIKEPIKTHTEDFENNQPSSTTQGPKVNKESNNNLQSLIKSASNSSIGMLIVIFNASVIHIYSHAKHISL